MKTQSQTGWLVDAALFLGLIAAFFPDLSGVELHQWIGILGGALAAYHLIAHWPWVGAVVRRFFGRTSNTSRLYLLLDGGIMLSFLSMIGSGLMISTWLNLSLGSNRSLYTLHAFASIGTLLMVVVKIALHWRWIVTVGQKVIDPAPAVPAIPAATGAVSRREFLGVMGLTGIAAAVALTSGARGLADGQRSEATTALDETTDASLADSAVPSASGDSSSGSTSVAQSVAPLPQASAPVASAASAACFVACRHGCSFPGDCRKYTDTNGNGLCDQGECI